MTLETAGNDVCLSSWAHFAAFLLSWKSLLSEAVTHAPFQGLGWKPERASETQTCL